VLGPFAGFLASGFKRAYGIKDFATTLPGHGGFIDRLDCQILCIIFCQVLLSQFIFRDEVNMDKIEELFNLNTSEQDQAKVLEFLERQISMNKDFTK
jgi:phosphatidate cytidylyltransferase